MWSFDIFKNWGFPEQDKFKNGIGYTQVGGAADASGEAAMPDQYGKTTTSGIVQRQRQKKGHKKGVMETVNMAEGPYGAMLNRGLKPNNQQTLGRKSDGMDLSLGNKHDPKWWEGLAEMAGVDPTKAAAQWKDKGGFEGLMANPAFTMGLAFMQAGAEGKTLGQGSLDSVMKAAGISSHYKKIIEARKMEPIQATSTDIAEVKDMLKSINIEEGNWFENFLGGPKSGARYEAAVEEIALEFQKEVRQKQHALKQAGKSQVIKRTDQLKILENLVKSGKIKKKGSWLSKIGITSDTLEDTSGNKGLARGGPMKAGKSYVVGEEGPEIVIPKESAQVLSNDNSKIYAMLLAANPQLQKVSRARSEKILRNRFPEYFE